MNVVLREPFPTAMLIPWFKPQMIKLLAWAVPAGMRSAAAVSPLASPIARPFNRFGLNLVISFFILANIQSN